MDSEDLLYLLYTSGTTAKPKGIMHTTGGYLAGVSATHRYIFDLHPETDVYWCMADIGWVTGHIYIVYGPLANATTGIIYEGAIDFPDKDRWAQIAAKYRATILYTAPTAIRALMKYGHERVRRRRPLVAAPARQRGGADQPRGVGVVLEVHRRRALPGGRHVVADRDRHDHDHAAARHHHPEAGERHLPVPGRRRPTSSTRPATPSRSGGGGYLVLERPWPAMLRGIYGDPERYEQTYWSRYPGRYFPGDGCKRDDEGYYWLLGRVDDVMNVSGHRISTTEVESALVSHPSVAEAAVVGRTDPITGQAIFSYVILRVGLRGVR